MKEFDCIFNLCNLTQDPNLDFANYLQEVVKLLHDGFAQPKKTQVRITHNNQIYISNNFKETINFISEKAIYHLDQDVTIEVFFENTEKFTEEKKRIVLLVKNMIESKLNKLKSDQRFNIIVDNAYYWVFWVELDTQFVYNSPSCERISGYNSNELGNHGSKIDFLIHEEDKSRYLNHIDQMLNTKETKTKYFRIKTKDGKTRNIEHICKAVFGAEDKLMGFRGTITDVTKIKKIEENLFVKENKFKTLFYKSPIPYLIIIDGVFIDCNLAAEKLYGGGREDIVGKTPTELSNEFQADGANSIIAANQYNNECFENGGASFRWSHSRGDASVILMQVELSLIDYDGNNALLVCWKDLTADHQKDEDIAKFYALAEQANYGIALTDMEGNLTYANHFLEEMHGYDKGELMNKNLTVMHNEEQLKDVFHLLELIKTEGGFSSEEVFHTRKDGSTFPTLMSAKVIFDDQQQPKFMSATMLDISQKQKDEAEIRKLTLAIEQSPVGIIISSLDSKINYVNSYFTTITGYSFEEAIGHNAGEFQSGTQEEVQRNDIRNVLMDNKTWKGDLINRRKNGDVYWEHLTVSPILDQKGKVTNYLAIISDITARKNAEEEIKEINHFLEVKIKDRTFDLEESNLELEKSKLVADEANRAKSDFLSRMSHELRTPMNSILGFAQLLEMGNLDHNQAFGVQHILKSGKLLLDLINEVLDISRIESGRISISIEPVEIKSVIKEIIDITLPLADSKKIKVSLEQKDDVSYYINADRQRLKQIFLNLINNAIKYNKPFGYVNVDVSIIKLSNHNPTVKVSIRDNGFGIAENDLPRIFNPFERINSENSNIEGTGLGLAVVNQLIGIMHGKIGVTSKLNEGSCFWVEFDECKANTGETITEPLPSNSIDQVKTNQKGNVLYIEDNPSNTDLVVQLLALQRPGLNLITSIYGHSTMALSIQHRPKLILLDLNLPDMHGSEVLMELKNNMDTKNIPVIILSADAMPKQIKNVMKIGATNYLTKPINISLLLQEIDKYITA